MNPVIMNLNCTRCCSTYTTGTLILCDKCLSTCAQCGIALTGGHHYQSKDGNYICACCHYGGKYRKEMVSHDLTCEKCRKRFEPANCMAWEYGVRGYAWFSVITGEPVCHKCHRKDS